MSKNEDYLYIPGLIDNRPNPIEQLGLTPEVVKQLGVDGLARALKAMHRVQIQELHPDITGQKLRALDQRRMDTLNAAIERVNEEDLITIKKKYLDSKSKRRAKKPAETVVEYERRRPNLNHTLGSDLIRSMHDPESVGHQQHLSILVSDEFDPFITHDDYVPRYDSLEFDDDVLVRHDLDHTLPVLTEGLDTIFSREAGKTDPFVKTAIRVIGDTIIPLDDNHAYVISGESIDVPEDIESATDAWYVARGVNTSTGDRRSIERFTPSGQSFSYPKMRILGSISPDAWRIIGKTEPLVQRRAAAIEGGTETDSESHNNKLSFKERRMSFTLDDLNRAAEAARPDDKRAVHHFTGRLNQDWILIGTPLEAIISNQSLIPLGTIKYGIAR